jgi:hypothetical protein
LGRGEDCRICGRTDDEGLKKKRAGQRPALLD